MVVTQHTHMKGDLQAPPEPWWDLPPSKLRGLFYTDVHLLIQAQEACGAFAWKFSETHLLSRPTITKKNKKCKQTKAEH